MRRITLIVAGIAAFIPMMALADLGPPPPPDTYSGPKTARVAGLTFARIYMQLSVLRGPHLVLENCDKGHPNCRIAKQSGVLGAWVYQVNGKTFDDTNPDDNPATFAKAFAASPKTITLTVSVRSSNPYEGKDVTVRFHSH